MYNPYGKYMLRIYVNGCYRMLTLDDRFLISHTLSPITAYSFQPEEIWVTLIEKGLLKA